MQASDLYVVAVYSNPLQWKSRLTLAKNFIQHMLASGVQLVVVETAYGERPYDLEAIVTKIPGFKFIGTRAKTMAWGKESAINVGVRSIPPGAKYVAWIDMDIEFRDPLWPLKTIQALQLKPVVQPWSEALDLGPDGSTMLVKNRHIAVSFGKVYQDGGNILDWWTDSARYVYPHCGYAWAARMEFLTDVGLLLDFSGLGAADHQMSLGIVGEIDRSVVAGCTESYKSHIRAWGQRAFAVSRGHMGCVIGRIEHFWHGDKALRKYVDRWQILVDNKFDPLTDVHRNKDGILELSGNKPKLERDVEMYFRQRDEDGNQILS